MSSVITYKPLRSESRPVYSSFFDDFFNFNLYDDFRKPLVDIMEKDAGYDFKVELPGFSENEIDVKIEKDVLTIKAEKSVKEDGNGKGRLILSERNEKYYRSFVLPENADVEKISAKFENGLLLLEVGKREKEEPRKIEIKK